MTTIFPNLPDLFSDVQNESLKIAERDPAQEAARLADLVRDVQKLIDRGGLENKQKAAHLMDLVSYRLTLLQTRFC